MKETDLLTRPVVKALQEHAIQAYPQEAVGLIINGEYVPKKNTHPEPDLGGVVPLRELLSVMEDGSLQAICHSHPKGPNYPSMRDMTSQREFDLPFVIVSTDGSACLKPFAWGDQIEPADLVGRGFMHGVRDCYALIRDWFFLERGIRLGEYPRDWEWWKQGQHLYEMGFAQEGFQEISHQDVTVGDCCLMAVRSPVPNHAAVVVENGCILHHATARQGYDPGCLSKRQTIERWTPYVTHWLRRHA